MESQLKHNTFIGERSKTQLLQNYNLWAANFEFIKLEISFLKTLIIAFPFKSKIPNLFEKLQLFNKDLDNLEALRTTIYSTIKYNSLEISKKTVSKKLNSNTSYLNTYYEITEEVLEYLETYKSFKLKLYEFIAGLINNKP